MGERFKEGEKKESSKGTIALDYPSGSNDAITSVLIRVRWRDTLQQMRRRHCDNGSRDCSDVVMS